MKRLCFFALALMFLCGATLLAEDIIVSSEPVVSSGTLTIEPFVWPVSTLIGKRRTRIVSKFGRRKIPAVHGVSTQTVTGAVDEIHHGIDFAVPPDSNVRAARYGKVLFAGYSTEYVNRKDKKDKHHLVIVRHADSMSTRYVHLNRIKVRPGQDVQSGDVLGTASNSDEWPEAVLHFEIREANGKPVDPLPLLTEIMQISNP